MQHLINKFRHHLPVILVSSLITLVFLIYTSNNLSWGFVQQLENFLYDTRVVLTMPDDLDPRIVIIDIDEKSLAEIGRWPWSRNRLAQMVTELFDYYGVSMIAFDMIFREPDTSSGIRILEQLAKQDLAQIPEYEERVAALKPSLDFDQQFIDSIAKGPVVLGYTFFSADENVGAVEDGVLPPPAIAAEDLGGIELSAPVAIGYGANIPVIHNMAVESGHITPSVDDDGRVRRVPMLIDYKGNYYASLSLAILKYLLFVEEVKPVFARKSEDEALSFLDLEGLEIGFNTIPVNVKAEALIPFRGRRNNFPYISASDVIRGRADPAVLQGTIAIVGTSSKGLVDLRPTPVNREYPGVEIHANIVSGVLDDRIKRQPAYVMGIEFVQLVLVGLVLTLLLPMLSPVLSTLLMSGVLTASLLVNFYFWQHNLVIPLATSLLLIAVLFLVNMSYGFFIERRGKKQLSGLFGQYLPPELVTEMSEDPETYTQDAANRNMTVLFSDIRNFTTISEGLTPEGLSSMLNEYLTHMTKIIHDHRGTIDKYIGDAVMAFWGAPLEDPDHPRHALLAGLAMLERLNAIREEFRERGWPEIHIGVGINTGVMSVGDMGSKFRMSYTVLGDAVNLGSRLEGLTKSYGVEIIVGETTRDAVMDYVYRELDIVKVKGKDQPISIFEPIATQQEVSAEELQEIELNEQAQWNYRTQDWDMAEQQFRELLQISGNRLLYQIYLDRIAEFREHPPGRDWDGVYTFKTK